MPNIGPLELVIILVIALLILGPGRLPDVGAALGKGIREFRKAATDVQDATKLEPAASTAEAASEPVVSDPPHAAVAPAAVEPVPAAPEAVEPAPAAPSAAEPVSAAPEAVGQVPADPAPMAAPPGVEEAAAVVADASGRPAGDDSATPASDAPA